MPVRKQNDPWELTDRAIEVLNRKITRRFQSSKKAFLIDNFDELNVIKGTDRLYVLLDSDAKRMFAELWKEEYKATHPGKSPTEDQLDEMADMALAGMLSEPDPVLHYIWDTETLRKRDRMKEAINAVSGNADKQAEMDRAMRAWSFQSGQYCENTARDAHIEALRASGLRKVQWVAWGDDKTCASCQVLDGQVFKIDDVPPPPHPRCRCWLKRV